MSSIQPRHQRPSGRLIFEAHWTERPSGRRRSRTFANEGDALAFLTQEIGEPLGTSRRTFDADAARAHLRRMVRIDDADCWLWTGSRSSVGYANMTWRSPEGDIYRGGHRVSYFLYRGAIPDGMQIDHLCHNAARPECTLADACPHRGCVNPDHLALATPRENILRSPVAQAALNAAKTHCPNGHPYSEGNTYHLPTKRGRYCRECLGAAHRRSYERRRQQAVSA